MPQIAPVVDNVDPSSGFIGGEDTVIHLYGTGFDEFSVIVFNGADEETVFVSPHELTTIVKLGMATVPSTAQIQVRNMQTFSGTVEFNFVVPPKPIPVPAPPLSTLVIDSLSPTEAVVTDPEFLLTVYGSGFTEQSVINFPDQTAPTVFVSETELTMSVTPQGVQIGSDPLLAVRVDVTVADGDLTSNAVEFRWNNN